MYESLVEGRWNLKLYWSLDKKANLKVLTNDEFIINARLEAALWLRARLPKLLQTDTCRSISYAYIDILETLITYKTDKLVG